MVGASPAVLGQPPPDLGFVTPHDKGVDQPVTAGGGEVVVGEPRSAGRCSRSSAAGSTR
jgi:hypothetical protein